jgi:transposase, IS5 family
MKQADLGLNLAAKRTRKREFLDEMNRVLPWADLVGLITPFAPEGRRGRPPFAVETMLRLHFMQQWFGPSGPAMKEALHDVPLCREFAGLDNWTTRLPDESTILRFRHLLDKHKLAAQMLASNNDMLRNKGLMLRAGTVVDATLIAAPSSTKNASGERDPEMHQTKKGNQWYFGMKAHIGADAESAIAREAMRCLVGREASATRGPRAPRKRTAAVGTGERLLFSGLHPGKVALCNAVELVVGGFKHVGAPVASVLGVVAQGFRQPVAVEIPRERDAHDEQHRAALRVEAELRLVLRIDEQVRFEHQSKDAQRAAGGGDAEVELHVHRVGVGVDVVEHHREAFDLDHAPLEHGGRIGQADGVAKLPDEFGETVVAHGVEPEAGRPGRVPRLRAAIESIAAARMPACACSEGGIGRKERSSSSGSRQF